ncbi:hypothetical protein BDV33DRAFT_193000 [Aspergillus novoparasiticus]|uniref:Uncharacterized protein n=1 Tax=Aspergillus novoparasiticus TaxID=986946 RepID=A0A5N6EKB6_9EURO|nr:hypothetical protein BDV33DRAFT_193000 [Aspergillus novoparasiticus]
MTPTLKSPKSSLMEQLTSPPKASLQILGTHITNEQAKVIDFDLWIDCSAVVGIRSGKFLTNSESDCRSWNYSPNQDNGNFEAILDGWLNNWLGDSRDGGSWTLCKLVSFPDDDCAAIKAYIESLARNSAYGGSIEVVFYTPSIDAWIFDCPFTPTDRVWNELVMNAMVDRKKGWISLNKPQLFYGMSSFRRAIRYGSTSRVVSQEQDADGFKRSVRQFSQWGYDGSS